MWSQELAVQGASLAQDRGRMEAQIESLSMEVKSLREQQKVSLKNEENCSSIMIVCVHIE